MGCGASKKESTLVHEATEEIKEGPFRTKFDAMITARDAITADLKNDAAVGALGRGGRRRGEGADHGGGREGPARGGEEGRGRGQGAQVRADEVRAHRVRGRVEITSDAIDATLSP